MAKCDKIILDISSFNFYCISMDSVKFMEERNIILKEEKYDTVNNG